MAKTCVIWLLKTFQEHLAKMAKENMLISGT